jgi:outer membrane protein assembly factor BamE (lipoprotein component of BamABCDE complex)
MWYDRPMKVLAVSYLATILTLLSAKAESTLLLNGQVKTYEEWTALLTKGLDLDKVSEILGEPTTRWPQQGSPLTWYYKSQFVKLEAPAKSIRIGFRVHFEDDFISKVKPMFVNLGRETKIYDRRGKYYKELELIQPPAKELEKGISEFVENHRVEVFKLGETGKEELNHLIMQMDSYRESSKDKKDLIFRADCPFAQLVKLNYPEHVDWLFDQNKLNLSKASRAIKMQGQEEWERNQREIDLAKLKVTVEFRLVLESGAEGKDSIKKKDSDGKMLTLAKAEDIVSKDIKYASAALSSNGWEISISFTEAGAKALAVLTENAVGKRLAIIVDDKLVTAPNINEPILGGNIVITSNFDEKEARQLANQIMGQK